MEDWVFKVGNEFNSKYQQISPEEVVEGYLKKYVGCLFKLTLLNRIPVLHVRFLLIRKVVLLSIPHFHYSLPILVPFV